MTNRRTFLSGSITAAAALPAMRAAGSAVYAYVGCYTTAQRYARGDGIHAYRFDIETGAWRATQHVKELVNPSFLALGPDQRCLYAVHGDEEYATAFSVDRATGYLALLNRASTGGKNGVHQAIDPGGRFLIVANYSSGSIAVLPIRAGGGLSDATEVIALPGQPGPHRIEQTGSHPHHVVFDPSGRFVLVPDKGLDRVFVFRFDPATGKLTPTAQGSAVARAGSGPRHAAFHPTLPVVWVVNEIGNTVATWQWDSERGHLKTVQILPSLPADFTGENTAAEIAVSPGGRFVYCSNRGHDSIAIFAAEPGSGLLASKGWMSTQGRSPRFIAFDPAGRFLCAANEQSDTVITFRADRESGRLTQAGAALPHASPTTIAFARATA